MSNKRKKNTKIKDQYAKRKDKLDKWTQGSTKRHPDAWARARDDSKSNVGEYRT